jgi:hypothetical protein
MSGGDCKATLRAEFATTWHSAVSRTHLEYMRYTEAGMDQSLVDRLPKVGLLMHASGSAGRIRSVALDPTFDLANWKSLRISFP